MRFWVASVSDLILSFCDMIWLASRNILADMEKRFIVTHRPRPLSQDSIIPVGVVAQRLIRELMAREIEKRMAKAEQSVDREECQRASEKGKELC
jgi:hypothetical protein